MSFTSLVKKTKGMHFTLLAGLHPSAEFYMYKKEIKYKKKFKFLGMIFDKKLTFKQHINYVKTDCNKMIGVLRSICSQEWGGDQKTILHFYKTFIRFKLDYGCIIYQSASNTTKQILNPIATECIRLATGAFKSKPVKSLHAISGEMNLELRRQNLTLKYYYKIKSQLKKSSLNVATSITDRRLYNNLNITPSV